MEVTGRLCQRLLVSAGLTYGIGGQGSCKLSTPVLLESGHPVYFARTLGKKGELGRERLAGNTNQWQREGRVREFPPPASPLIPQTPPSLSLPIGQIVGGPRTN